MSHTKTQNDPAKMQTAAGFPLLSDIDTTFQFTEDEINHLRQLGEKISEISKRDEQKEKAALWTQHNDLHADAKPVILADPENGWNEIIDADGLKCEDPLARVWEMYLLKQIYWAEEIKDDKVIEGYFDVPYCYTDTGWGVTLQKHGGEDSGSYKVDPAIMDYEQDLPNVKFPEIIILEEESKKMFDLAHEVFDGILTVRRKTTWWWTLGMTWDFINLRGLDNLMMDLILYPDQVHKLMKLLSDGYLKRLDWLQDNGYLDANVEGTYVGSGGFGFTEQLPCSVVGDTKVLTENMWGFCESQETVGVSPEMFSEFILPYQLPIMEKFGLNCYGCCEPLDMRWEYIKEIPRLRRVSASPWADKEKLANMLKGDYIMSVKLSPTPLASPKMDENVVRQEIKDVLAQTKGCRVELIMKDNHTLGNNPRNITRWVEIAREEINMLA